MLRPLRRTARFTLPVLACALAAAVPQASTAAARGPAADHDGAAAPGYGSGPGTGGWVLTSRSIDPDDTHHAYVGNGYLGQRIPPNGTGYAASGEKTGFPLYTPRYDGAFAAGLYSHNKKTAKNRQAVAALPTWSTLDVATRGRRGETFSSATPRGRISHYRQSLDMRRGLVHTALTWTAKDGRATDLAYDVLADRNHPHAAAVRATLRPHWNGTAHITDAIDGRGARRLKQTGGGPAPTSRSGDPTMNVTFRADGTKTPGAVASTLHADDGLRTARPHPARAAKDLTAKQGLTFSARRGHTYAFTKYVGVDTGHTAKDPAHSALAASRAAAARGWHATYAAHTASWRKLWRSDIEVAGHPDLQKWLRSAQYGLLANTRRGSGNSLAPAGLTSDNYAGEIFWDAETWMYPSLLAAHPHLARSVLDYRYRTREGARRNARKLGYDGLFYPWTSGRDGDLWKECHSWDPPHCKTQNHLQSDIAFATWQHYLATGDKKWLRQRGWPVLKGIAAFWASRVTKNDDGSYSVKNVAGPDEYSNGVDDGVFTNAGAATTLRQAAEAAKLTGHTPPAAWTSIADHMSIPFDKKNGVFRQYDGYEGSVIKQADTVLLQYPLQWPMSKKTATKTLDYYASRTDPDGPAMTDSVHAIDAAQNGEPGCTAYTYLDRSIRPFVRGPYALFSEARGDKAGASDPLAGSPAQDFLTGKGGFLQGFTAGLAGQRMGADTLHLDPMLPPQLSGGVTLKGLHWQGRTYDVAIGAHETTVRLTRGTPFTVDTPQGDHVVSAAAPAVLKTRRPDLAPTRNLARCQSAKATSQQPGMYAGSAVDGGKATSWTPDGKKGALTVRLAKTVHGAGAAITPTWTKTRPAGHRTQVSADGRHWRTADGGTPGKRPFRYVRVTVTVKDPKKPAGIEELTVTGGTGHRRN